ncbi:MAG: GntR family transcriptional regulator [Alphaproteobacteria bacterium]|nr:GntR family transcriptional regulator [Alphaproteobacteria bacterium]
MSRKLKALAGRNHPNAGCVVVWYTIYLTHDRSHRSPVEKLDRRTLDVPRLDTSTTFRKEAYAALKRAITAMDVYDHPQEIRLDERRLSEGLGISRTPIREAMTLLEQEGFVRTRPRRGIFVVRKTKREIVEIITVIAALEGMAARLAALRASDADIAELHALMDDFRNGNGGERLAEYSDANIAFHQTIIRMSGCALLAEMTENLFIHMRAIRKITIHRDDRAARSIVDHMRIIEALERREPDLAEQRAREHTLGLAAHVEQHGDFLDPDPGVSSPAPPDGQPLRAVRG